MPIKVYRFTLFSFYIFFPLLCFSSIYNPRGKKGVLEATTNLCCGGPPLLNCVSTCELLALFSKAWSFVNFFGMSVDLLQLFSPVERFLYIKQFHHASYNTHLKWGEMIKNVIPIKRRNGI